MALKVLTLVGTRPELIKLSRVIAALDRHCEHVLVHSGQNYDHELNGIFFQELGIRAPDVFLNAVGASAAETVGNIIARVDEVLAQHKPDAFLILGDTNSCLGAYSAKRRRVPIFHMEAGNRCFDDRVPEEINRRIIDHISDINLTYTEHARRYLLAEGLTPQRVIKTGSPMREVIDHHRAQIDGSDVLARLGLEAGRFFLVSSHREENVDDERNFTDLLASLNALAERFDEPVLVSTHPRTAKRLEALGDRSFDRRIRFMKPLGFPDYVHLQMKARCVVSDSGTLTEESSLLGFPAIMIRQAHERPEGDDQGVVVMSGLGSRRVLEAVDLVTAQATSGWRSAPVADYAPADVSDKVVRIIHSYTDYVRRTVWREG